MPFLRSFLKKNIIIIVLIALVYGWFFATHLTKHENSVQILGANTNISLFEQPDTGRTPILDAINNAHQEVLVEVYILSDKQIIEALEDAKARGITVDVMLEEHPFGGGNLNNKTKPELESKGISVKWTSSSFTLTHEKAIVIDDAEAWILNQNLTASSFTKNREYDVVDTNPEDVTQVRNIFIDDWDRKSFTPPTTTHLIVSPLTSRAGLTTLINSATKTIDIEVEVIDDNQIASLLSSKAKNVEVRLIVPTFSQISTNSKVVKELKHAGALVKTLSSPYIHAKLILIDDQKAYVGSVNLSTQSMDENRELGIMLSQNDSIQTLNSTFESDWNNAKEIN